MGKFSNSLTRQFNRQFGVSAEQGGRQFGYDQRMQQEADAQFYDQLRKQLLEQTKVANEQRLAGERQQLITNTDFNNLTPERIAELDRFGVKTSDIENIQDVLGQKLPTITQSDYRPVEEVDKDLAKKYPNHIVEVTTKKKGDQVISETYGSPMSKERATTKTGYGTEYAGLSDYEKTIMRSVNKEWVHNNSAKRVAKKYGEALFEYTDDDGLKWTETLPYETSTKATKGGREYEVMGVKERVEQIRRRQIATIQQLIGDDKLGIYRELDKQYPLDNTESMTDVEFVKSAREFKNKVRQAYLNKEIDEGDFTLYKGLIERTFDMSYDAIR